MNKRFRHGARRARGLGLCAALLAAAACEEPTLPTELDEIRYSTVSIDESTLVPEPGASLTRGQIVTYDVDVLYQRSTEDVAAAGDVLLGFYVEMWDSVPDVGWSWLGDAVDSVVTVSGSEGSLSFAGSFTVPPVAPRCETYDVIRVLAIMDPASNTAYRDTETYPLTGTATIPSAGTMSFGESRSGSLDAGVNCESWTLTLDAAQTVALALGSETLDTYLILQTSTGTEIARDDDSGGNLNSLIAQDLQAGTYRVLVSTYGGGEGDYVLSATAATNACTLAGTLTPGGSGTGTLGAGDCQFDDGSYYDFWTLNLASDDSIAIDMSSAEFDTYLLLADGSGTVVGENDDFGTGTDSRIEVRLTAGTYTIYANSFGPGETGSYGLSVTSLGGGTVDPCLTWTPVAVGTTTTGMLESTDCAPGDGYYYEGYELGLASETAVTITLTSTQYDAFLIVTDATNSDPSNAANWIAFDENGGGGTDAQIVDTLPAGNYVVWVSSSATGETGAYSLSVEESASTAPITIATARGQAAGTSVTVEGVITAGTGVYSDQTFYLQDASAGVAVFLGTGSTAGPFAEGDTVLVSGDIGAFNSEVQIEGAVEVTVLGTTSVPAARAVTVDEANTGQWQGELVQVAGLVVDSVGTPSAAGDFTVYTTHTTGTGGTLPVFVDATTGITTVAFTAGATYDITGVMSVFNSVFEVKPRRLSDIQQVAAANPCTTWQPVSIGGAPTGTLAATDCAPGDGWYYEGYELTITAATSVTMTLTSTEFDAFLILTDTVNSEPSVTANWLGSDNNSAGGTDARLAGTIDPGTYVIWVSSNSTGEVGAYQLTVQ